MFDFRAPNNKQVLLNADGSVASVKPIHLVTDPDAGDPTTDELAGHLGVPARHAPGHRGGRAA